MSWRAPLWGAACAVTALALGCGGASPTGGSPPPRRPNFVVIVADDMAYGMFGAGRRFSFLQLPHLERLAAQGVQFDRAFVTTSLCSPSRASLFSGLYAHTHGVTVNETVDLAPDVATFPQVLRSTGYRTALVGKWHMDAGNDGPRPGFEHWVSFRGQGVYQDPLLNVNGLPVRRAGYTTDILTEYAVDWLAQQSPSQPFMMVLAHKAAHAPFTPAARHEAHLAEASLPEPPSYRDSFTDKPAWQRRYARCGGTAAAYVNCPDPLPATLPPWAWSTRDDAKLDYMRTLIALDDSVGAVMAALERGGQASNTYVVFTSDNGFFLGEHRMGDKRLAYEEALRVPLVIGGAGLGARRVGSMALNLDLAPTVLELAGAPVPAAVQGRSLAGVLRGTAGGVRDAFLYEYAPDRHLPVIPRILAVRTQALKYVTYPDRPGDCEMYDLSADPAEVANLCDRPGWEGARADLQRRLDALLAETNGPPQ
jgi:N-acetylglucosamine-6-sulfatase